MRETSFNNLLSNQTSPGGSTSILGQMYSGMRLDMVPFDSGLLEAIDAKNRSFASAGQFFSSINAPILFCRADFGKCRLIFVPPPTGKPNLCQTC